MDFKLKNLETILPVSKIANVHFFDFPQNYETKNDKHPFCELLFINSGSLRVYSDEYTGKLQKNQMIIHGANCVHSLTCKKKKETMVIIIGFECFTDKLAYFAKHPITLNEAEVKQLAEIVKEGRNVFAPPYNVPLSDMRKKSEQVFGSEQMLRAHLEIFLINLIRKHECFEPADENEKSGFAIEEIVNYVDANFTEHMTINELAFLFRTNRTTLCNRFKAATEKTLIQYINTKKINLAKELLHTEKSVSEIAATLNFESLSYFNRTFKKYTALSPTEYQETLKHT